MKKKNELKLKFNILQAMVKSESELPNVNRIRLMALVQSMYTIGDVLEIPMPKMNNNDLVRLEDV